MARIQVLDKSVAELIAAGEVVERPASIVKELLENAIDAGADQITVELEDGGISLIRITDNGCGMEPEDVPKAFLRHATSKVRSVDDLDAILTLGFRGEALASIAAMSRVELTTKTLEAQEGTTCQAVGGEVFEPVPAGCPDGTTITVRDVFFNTPARMKFLKKNTSEGSAAALIVDKCALSHPEIAFKLRRDGKTTLQTSGNGDLLAVIYAVYGREFAGKLLPVGYTSDQGIRISGYISKPEASKASRTYQTFFINSRYVRTRTGVAALEQGYKNKMMVGKFPACVLNIQMEASVVDVNVHPAKIEVRFADERPVFNAVYFAVKTALAKLDQSIPLLEDIDGIDDSPVVFKESPSQTGRAELYPPAKASVQETMTAQEFRVLFDTGEPQEEVNFHKPLPLHSSGGGVALKSRPDIYVDRDRSINREKNTGSPGYDKKQPMDFRTMFSREEAEEETTTSNQSAIEDPPEQMDLGNQRHRTIGELFGTYILLERDNHLVLVDKHAAHERILYERLKENLSYGNRQLLLMPQTVVLSREEYGAVLEHLDTLDALGFTVEDFGGSTVVVREMPIELGQKDVEHIISEVADKLSRGVEPTPVVLDRLYYSIACRSAIKAGDKNNLPELERLVELLEENPEITHCPHGRPVSVTLTRHQIEKFFGRLG